MLDDNSDHPPPDVSEAIAASGKFPDPALWQRLSGGRTNRLWRFESCGQVFVCKLFSTNAATPMFPNDAKAEAMALRSLAGTGLAPNYGDLLSTPSGDVLIYEFVANAGPQNLHQIATALAQLHRQKAPAGLRSVGTGAQAILKHGDTMLRGLEDPRLRALRTFRPDHVDTGFGETVFLHGDPVPSNIIAARCGPCLIDWQCPATGDPTEDLAIFLSPAMQSLYGGQVLNKAESDKFLTAYGHPDRAERYQKLVPFHHWRMAAYCLWKTNVGDADYSAAADLEITRLQQVD